MLGVDQRLRNCFAGFLCRQCDFDEGGEATELVDELTSTVDFGATMHAEPGGDELEGDDLGAECFC